jgi:hypothetical protein
MKNWGELFLESNTLNAFSATSKESVGTKYLFLDFDDTVRESVNYDGVQGPPTEKETV